MSRASAPYRLPEEAARRFHLVSAIEREDTEAVLLTREDREQADYHARGVAAGEPRAYLAARADFAAERLATRQPALAGALARTRWPAWIGAALPIAAFVLGLLSNELTAGKRLELLAFPLLGLIVWNVVIYVSIAVRALVPGTSPSGSRMLIRLRDPLGRFNRDVSGTAETMPRAIGSFLTDFGGAARRLMGLRATRTLHLAAAMFAFGLIASIFLRALTVEYRAGWESTFLDANAVHALLSALLAPASAVTGLALPDEAGIAALRWDADESGGANAGPWIMLYTATAIGFVVIPRLLLAGLAAAGVARARGQIAIPGREDFYVRRLLRAFAGGGGVVRVTPYAYTPGDATRRHLKDLLATTLGEGTQVRFDEPVPYGTEDVWMEAMRTMVDTDFHIALFSLTATPEQENHGWFVDNLATHRAHADAALRVVSLVDKGPFVRRFTGQAGFAERLETRSEGWRSVLHRMKQPALVIDLACEDCDGQAESLESVLLTDAAMRGGR